MAATVSGSRSRLTRPDRSAVAAKDCFVLKVTARPMRHLEEITGRIAALGAITTSVVYSTPLARRDLTPAVLGSEPAPPDRASAPAVRARRRQAMAN
jgi:hypothetical protein